jgi:bacterioferritin (cytochrome b1)
LNIKKKYYFKGNADVVKILNDLLADELTTISQSMVHSERCDDWGYARLQKIVEECSTSKVAEQADQGTSRLLNTILVEEEAHIDWIEAQQEQIAQMGIQLYLALQVKD